MVNVAKASVERLDIPNMLNRVEGPQKRNHLEHYVAEPLCSPGHSRAKTMCEKGALAVNLHGAAICRHVTEAHQPECFSASAKEPVT